MVDIYVSLKCKSFFVPYFTSPVGIPRMSVWVAHNLWIILLGMKTVYIDITITITWWSGEGRAEV